jgi:hypothetical protein
VSEREGEFLCAVQLKSVFIKVLHAKQQLVWLKSKSKREREIHVSAIL